MQVDCCIGNFRLFNTLAPAVLKELFITLQFEAGDITLSDSDHLVEYPCRPTTISNSLHNRSGAKPFI